MRRIAVALLALSLASACGKSNGSDGEKTRRFSSKTDSPAASSEDALIETHDKANVAWIVTTDGTVSAKLSTPEGQPIVEKVEATIRWKTATGEAKSASLVFDPQKNALVAQGPRLEADLTELDYTVTYQGAPYVGTLHLPPGGTAQLVADAKIAGSITIAADAKGPHGGTIQVVGEDRVEVVASAGTDEVRVYVLDEKLAPVEVGDRTITLAVVSERGPEVVVLRPIETKVYFTGKWKVVGDVRRVTVVVRRPGRVRVAIVGWRPGVILFVGVRAPHWKLRVGLWGEEEVKFEGKHHHHKWKKKHK